MTQCVPGRVPWPEHGAAFADNAAGQCTVLVPSWPLSKLRSGLFLPAASSPLSGLNPTERAPSHPPQLPLALAQPADPAWCDALLHRLPRLDESVWVVDFQHHPLCSVREEAAIRAGAIATLAPENQASYHISNDWRTWGKGGRLEGRGDRDCSLPEVS